MRRDRHFHAPLFFWEANAGGGTGTPAPPPAPPAAPPAQPPAAPPAVPTLPAEAQSGFNNLLGRYNGNSDAVATLLYNDNRDLRHQNTELKKQVPGEGAVVLSGDDASAYQNYLAALNELGVKPGDVKDEILSKRKYERDAQLAEVAAAKGWSLEALKAVQGIDNMKFEIREEADPNNAESKVKKVFTKNSEGQDVPIETLPTVVPLLPALQVQTAPPAPTGVPFVRQSSGGSAPPAPGDPVAKYLSAKEQANAAMPNPLMPGAIPVAPAANALGGK